MVAESAILKGLMPPSEHSSRLCAITYDVMFRSWQGSGLRTGFFQSHVVAGGCKERLGEGEASVIRARLRVPVPLAGKWEETERTRVGAPSRAAPRPAHGYRVSIAVLAGSRPEPAHSRCLRLAGAT